MQYKPIKDVKVVGIGHRARQGKDTFANFLLDKVPGSRKYSFAEDLKAFARVLGMKEKDGPLLQALGTEVFRRLDENIWTRCLYYKILEDRPTLAVIPDVRFPNELKMITDMGGSTVDIIRLNEDGSRFVAPDRDPNHSSEVALDNANWSLVVEAKTGDLKTIENYAEALRKSIGL